MAKYCDSGCKETGGVCDFCIYYEDEYAGTDGFSGQGVCVKKNEKVVAYDGCDDEFHCSLIKEEVK